jgi:hypothetical protein
MFRLVGAEYLMQAESTAFRGLTGTGVSRFIDESRTLEVSPGYATCVSGYEQAHKLMVRVPGVTGGTASTTEV